MAGFVIKSHIWPTAAEAYLLDRMVEEFPDQYAFRYTTLDSVSYTHLEIRVGLTWVAGVGLTWGDWCAYPGVFRFPKVVTG